MISESDHRLLSTSFSLSFDPGAGHWTLRASANEGYEELGTRKVCPSEMSEIAKGLDHLFFGDVPRRPYTALVASAHAAAKRSLADEIRNLDAAMVRREAKVQALAAFEDSP